MLANAFGGDECRFVIDWDSNAKTVRQYQRPCRHSSCLPDDAFNNARVSYSNHQIRSHLEGYPESYPPKLPSFAYSALLASADPHQFLDAFPAICRDKFVFFYLLSSNFVRAIV